MGIEYIRQIVKGYVMKIWKLLFLTLIVGIVMAACGGNEEPEAEDQERVDETIDEERNDVAEETNESAEEEVVLMNNEGEETATATLSEGEHGVNIELIGENLLPVHTVSIFMRREAASSPTSNQPVDTTTRQMRTMGLTILKDHMPVTWKT